ncbi:MAG: LPS assembly protein LptD [Acidobacteriia bacterium]|nr:LPS assembly protein LptD [Terriglobia bacterium]
MATLILATGPLALGQTPAKVEPPPPASIPKGKWDIGALRQEKAGPVQKLHSTPEGGGEIPFQAWIENSRMVFRADEVVYNQDTGDIEASGHVYFHDFVEKQEMWCDRLEYNTDEERGKFYNVRGQAVPRIVARPGVLPSASPFYFQGRWAERDGMPAPWWRLRGPKFVISPGKKAAAYRTVFLLRGVPLFYTPFFYHSLEKEPRKSGFLLPNIGNSSQRGLLIGLGYYWAINQSYDATYRVMDYTSRGFAHHLDLRGKPRPGTDFYAILYGVQDRGRPGSNPADKYGGLSLYATGKSDLGGGWTAHADVNYITSFRFRQEWTQSYNELIGSEINSVGFVNKNFSTYTFDGVFSRLENFQTAEVAIPPGSTNYVPNVVSIRKLPEAQLSGRDRRIWSKLPVWLSFDSSAGLLYRSQPIFNADRSELLDHFQTGPAMERVSIAPRVIAPVRLGYIHLIPSFGFQETYYSEGQTPYQDWYRPTGTNIVRNAREFALEIVFPSLARVYRKKTFLGDRLKHVIQPRATYRYVTGIGENFNDFIRFDETDLLSNTNELLFSLTNRIYAKRGDSVQEVFTWTLMQKRYFDPTFGGALLPGQRNVFESTAELAAYAFVVGPRGASPVISSLRISPVGGIGVRWQADYDPRMHGIVDSQFEIEYRWQPGGSGSGPTYFASARNIAVHVDPILASPQNQYGFRAGWGDANRRGFNAVIDGVYDYRNHFLARATVTTSYNTDCCGLSFQYNRFNTGLRDDWQYRVAFAIANVGSFGTLRKQDRMF